jgi:hypothetical protein
MFRCGRRRTRVSRARRTVSGSCAACRGRRRRRRTAVLAAIIRFRVALRMSWRGRPRSTGRWRSADTGTLPAGRHGIAGARAGGGGAERRAMNTRTLPWNVRRPHLVLPARLHAGLRRGPIRETAMNPIHVQRRGRASGKQLLRQPRRGPRRTVVAVRQSRSCGTRPAAYDGAARQGRRRNVPTRGAAESRADTACCGRGTTPGSRTVGVHAAPPARGAGGDGGRGERRSRFRTTRRAAALGQPGSD